LAGDEVLQGFETGVFVFVSYVPYPAINVIDDLVSNRLAYFLLQECKLE
jgi:hypothetical protein